MTNTEQKALELVNEICHEWGVSYATDDEMDGSACFTALCRAIKQHEAFRQEVSDAVQTWVDGGIDRPAWIWFRKNLERFIITKPDPLVDEANAIVAKASEEGLSDYEIAMLALRRGREMTFDDR